MTILTVPHAILYPACTRDYAITASSDKCGGRGLGLVALRNIRKGRMIFDDSLEYTFTDVALEGDYMLFDHNEQASKETKSMVPSKFQLTPDVLLRTHGVPCLDKKTMTVSWQLEVPGMFMNHSCDPNVKAYPRSSDDAEDYAARNIDKRDELTVDYCLQFYDHGPFFEKCECGAVNCRGSMMGFAALSDAEKERLFPLASDYVQAMHLANLGRGPLVKEYSVQKSALPRVQLADSLPREIDIPRMVIPGPSHALADAIVQQDAKTGEFGLYALRDFKSGSKVYEFWHQVWPDDIPEVVDMVFAHRVDICDPPEGTIVRIDANKLAMRDRSHRFMFSGWAMLVKHSCDPNLVYDNAAKHEDEDWEWHSAYAAKNIKKGDQLTIDFNCMLWDRSKSFVKDECDCGSVKCAGTSKGFKYLPHDAQEERMRMSWRRCGINSFDMSKQSLGFALSSHIRECWRKSYRDLSSDTDDSSLSSSSCSNEEHFFLQQV
jgi:hypothetical protein